MSKSKPETIAAAAPDRDYIVVTPVELGGVIYRAGDTIMLTDEQAEHPIEVGAVKPTPSE